MSPQATHCLPNGVLGTAELPVPNVSQGTMYVIHATTGVGRRRGVLVYLHGLATSNTLAIPGSFAPVNTVAGGLPVFSLMMLTQMAADGWEVIVPSYQEDSYVSIPSTGLYNDVAADTTGNGARYLTSTEHHWDHILAFINQTYGTNFPVVVIGESIGSLKFQHFAAYDQTNEQRIVAGATINNLSHIGVLSQQYVPSPIYGAIYWNGLDITATAAGAGFMNNVIIPTLMMTGSTDGAVGYNYGTLNQTGPAASTLAASTITLNAPSGSAGGAPTFVTSGTATTAPAIYITNGTGGWAYCTVTGVAGNTLTGVTYIAGSAGFTLAPGQLVVQNLTPLVIANQQAAQPGNKITANLSNANHTLPLSIAGQFTYPTGYSAGTTLSSIQTAGTLNVASTAAQNGTSVAPTTGHAWILASDGFWHQINWTGSSGTTYTGVTFTAIGSGGAATITGGTFVQGGQAVAFNPIATDVYGVGGAIPLWFFNVVELASLTGGPYPQVH